MGKKKRYRLRAAKFSKKYSSKYGLNRDVPALAEQVETPPEPVIVKTVEPPPIPVVNTVKAAKAAPTPDPIVEALETTPKKKTTLKKKTPASTKKSKAATPRKPARKKATKAKTTT
jgi:hypothetical protein